ncbi:MAG: hypothetical protein NW207_09590 [Cytophagales bacterium]|nr:hypothetical protein [Cytophagales bacterium]
MHLFKKISLSGIASLSFAASSLAVNKIFSVYFGAAGVGILGHFQNIVAIFLTIPNDGINRSVNKFITKEASQSTFNDYFSWVLAANAAIFIILIVFFALTPSSYAFVLPPALIQWPGVAILILGVLLHIITVTAVNLIISRGYVPAFTVFSVLNNAGVAMLAYYFHHKGIVYSIFAVGLGINVMLVPMLIYLYVKEKNMFVGFKYTLNMKAAQHVVEFILIALSGIVFGRLVDLYVRTFVITHFSLTEAGLLHGVVKISDGYSTVFSAALGALLISKFAGLANDNIGKEVLKVAGLVTMICAFGLAVLYLCPEYFLLTLYNQDFVAANDMLRIQLIGDFFKFPAWIVGFMMMAQLRTKAYLALQAFSALVYILLISILIYSGLDNIIVVPIANSLRFFIYFVAMFWINMKYFLK